jgi:hypothetical protein
MKQSFLSRLLDPVSSVVEAIYSVLIVLTFTLAFRVIDANAWPDQTTASALVSELFVAAFGCAVAWGLIDGVMYVLAAMFERGQQQRLLRSIRDTAGEEEGIEALAGELDDTLEPITDADDRQSLYRTLYHRLQDSTPRAVGFKREDFAGALGVALVAVGAALPVVLPLWLFAGNPTLAIRLSNLVGLAMLFWLGFRWGKYAGTRPLKTGLLLLLVGVAMMAVAIPLGG